MTATKLVIGASGFLGSHVTRQLVAAGEDVRVMLRRSSSTKGIDDLAVERCYGDVFDDAALRVDYRLLEGDLDTFEGSWTFLDGDGRTSVKLGIEYDFGVPTLAELIGPTLHKKVRENAEMMLLALKRQAEGAARRTEGVSALRDQPHVEPDAGVERDHDVSA